MTALITAGLTATASLLIALTTRTIARDGGHDVHRGADDEYATQLHELADVTAEMAAIAAECPPELAPQPAHRGRHHHDTVEIVGVDYRPLYSPAFAAVMGYDREQVSA